MKSAKYCSFILPLLIVVCMGCNGLRKLTGDKGMYEKLMAMNFKEYENKEVGVFFSDFGYDYTTYIPTTKKPGFISHVIFRYSDSLSIDIAVKDLGQSGPVST